MAAMREGTTRGMMMPFNMLRKRFPMNSTYMACLWLQVSLAPFSPNPRAMPEK